MEIGQSLGLSARVQYQTDAKFVDLYSYIQKIIQHTPLSIFPTGIFPSSIRMSSLSFEYLPARSQIKELNLVVRLSTKGMTHSLSHKKISEQQYDDLIVQPKPVKKKKKKTKGMMIL